MYLTPQAPTCSSEPANGAHAPEAGAPEIEITPQMIAVGEERLLDLLEVREPAYVVQEVFSAMLASSCRHLPR